METSFNNQVLLLLFLVGHWGSCAAVHLSLEIAFGLSLLSKVPVGLWQSRHVYCGIAGSSMDNLDLLDRPPAVRSEGPHHQ